jgi:monoamine oxidase
MQRDADVVIVGAGLSGLVAASEVLAAGYEPLVVEADDRVGGRILTQQGDGLLFEVGAQWIGDTHHEMEALATKLGLTLLPQFDAGETSYEIGGEVLRQEEFHARYGGELEALEATLRLLDRMAETVPAQAPWTAPRADEWDRVTTGAFFDAQGLSPVARTLLEICTVGILAVPTVEVSLLDTLFNISVCGVTADLFAESEGGAQTKRFVEGTSQVPLRLAATLGDRIVLSSPALTLDWTNDSVTVTCRGGLVARGRQAIVALSPTLAGRIMYDPPMPGVRDQMTQRVPLASAHKAFLVYDEPFWRADGLNGQVISEVGPARMSNDVCPPHDPRGVLLAFLEGESARVAGRWEPEVRRDALAEEMVRHFGPRAREHTGFVEGGWIDRPWTRGCYNVNTGPCTWIHFGEALARPVGPIKWGATETAHRWSGYMEGALEAGRRAAHEVLADLT